MQRVLQGLNLLTLLAWPFLVWAALTRPEWRWLFWLLALLFILRGLALHKKHGPLATLSRWIAITGALLCLSSLLLRREHGLLWYPVVVNALMLAVFAASLFSPHSLVERLARLREPHLPAAGVHYTRRVTQIWCLFFVINGSIAAATCIIGNVSLWTVWNGCISYLLMGALMGGEWLVRVRVRRRT